MTWLKKVGSLVLKITGLITAVVPATTGGKLATDLDAIAQIVIAVEVMGQVLGTAGADKLKAATPLVAQIVLQSGLMAGHKIANPVLFQQGAAEIAAGMADVLNSLKDEVAVTTMVA